MSKFYILLILLGTSTGWTADNHGAVVLPVVEQSEARQLLQLHDLISELEQVKSNDLKKSAKIFFPKQETTAGEHAYTEISGILRRLTKVHSLMRKIKSEEAKDPYYERILKLDQSILSALLGTARTDGQKVARIKILLDSKAISETDLEYLLARSPYYGNFKKVVDAAP